MVGIVKGVSMLAGTGGGKALLTVEVDVPTRVVPIKVGDGASAKVIGSKRIGDDMTKLEGQKIAMTIYNGEAK